MLKGFNYPLTPKGKSTLNPSPVNSTRRVIA